jgi:hypothetical protein
VPPCTGKDGLFELVPEAVVRDLREECAGPKSGYRPTPILRLEVDRDADHELDDGPELFLSSDSDPANGGGDGFLAIDRDGPPLGAGSKPTLKDLKAAFGKPRRTHCGARWAKLALKATVCASGVVRKLTLGTPWQLFRDTELGDRKGVGNAEVLVGDTVELAHYLDPRLATLGPNQRLRLSKLRIGKADVTTTVVTHDGHITAIEIAIQQRRG